MADGGSGSVSVDFIGDEKDLLAAAKAVQGEMDKLSKKLKDAGVSQTAYNKAVSSSIQNQKVQSQALQTSIPNWKSIGMTAVAAGAAVVKFGVDSYKTYQTYAGSVRDLAAISGTGAAQTSLFLQVLDDFEISAENATTATKALTKQGLVPNLETLAKLSDEYKAIQDPIEKNQFLLKNLGKAGLEWVNVLNQGSAALLESGTEVNKNLILTDKQIEDAEKARLAVDAVSDSWEGFKVAIGAGVGEMIVAKGETEDLREQFNELGLKEELATSRLDQGATPAFDRFRKTMEKSAAMTEFYTQQVERQNTTLAITDEQYGQMLKGGLALTEMQGKIDEQQTKINDTFDDSAYVTALYQAEVADLTKDLKEGDISQQDYQKSLSRLKEDMQSGVFAAQELAKANQTLTSQAVDQYEAYAASVLAVKEATNEQQLEFAVASGQITQQAANQQMAQDKLADAYIAGQISAEQYAAGIKRMMDAMKKIDGKKATVSIDFIIRQIMGESFTGGGNVGGGSGGIQGTGGPHVTAMAGGGTLAPLTLVGDMPGGILTPYSELIIGNQVVDAKTTRRLFDLGLVGDYVSRAGGGATRGSWTKPGGGTVNTSPKPKPRPSGGSVLGSVVTSTATAAASVSETEAATQTQSVLQMQADFIQAVTESNIQTQNQIEVLIGVMKGENPRAIGREVSAAVAKTS